MWFTCLNMFGRVHIFISTLRNSRRPWFFFRVMSATGCHTPAMVIDFGRFPHTLVLQDPSIYFFKWWGNTHDLSVGSDGQFEGGWNQCGSTHGLLSLKLEEHCHLSPFVSRWCLTLKITHHQSTTDSQADPGHQVTNPTRRWDCGGWAYCSYMVTMGIQIFFFWRSSPIMGGGYIYRWQ